MFDREKAIATWRDGLAKRGSFFESDLDELEGHLRDHLDALEEVELTGEAAFRTALEGLGEAGALGDEFAKVNRALVWRAPLFWLAAGGFATLVAMPVVHALSINASHVLPQLVPLIIAIRIGGPAVLYAALLSWAWTRHGTGDPIRAAASSAGRVALVAGGALVWIGVRFIDLPIRHVPSLDGPAAFALNLSWRFDEIVRPLGVIALVIVLRAIALAGGRRTSLFWVVLGSALATAAQELELVATITASFGSARWSLDVHQAQLVVGLVTLAVPALVCAAAVVWARRSAPSPDDFLRSRRVIWTFAIGSAAVLAAHLGRADIVGQTPGWTNDGSLLECLRIHSQTKVITAAWTSVALGTLMLRARARMLLT